MAAQLFIRICVLITLLLCSAMSCADTTQQQALKDVKNKITQQQALLKSQKQDQTSLNNALRRVEGKIASAAKELYKTNQQLILVAQEQQQLRSKEQNLNTQKVMQQAALSKQVKSAYMTGNHNVLQLILNQDKSSETQRLLGYYHFLNKARIESITQLKQTLTELQYVQSELKTSEQRLTALKKTQLAHEKSLGQEKNKRSKALQALNKSYLKNSEDLERYQLSEIDIKQLIRNAQQVKPIKLNGLTQHKRKLKHPVKGKIRHRFGSKRHGRLLWKGITIAGNEGQSISAIHHGKVIYSDWIKGFGLVIVIDHGKGFMSLYGHNQALLKNAGDMVTANEKIALLGQSGGQNQPGLYFEIRYKGKAINPTQWLKK
mgnify:CR=1 FL=1